MRTLAVALVAISFSGCDNPVVSRSPVSPTSVTFPAVAASTPAVEGVLAFSSFLVSPIRGAIKADFTLTETQGGGVTLESLTFEESGGRNDFVDAGCFGDEPIKIPARGSFDGKTLGYCQPIIQLQSPGDFASLTAVYKQADGRRDTVRALIRLPRI